MFASPLAATLLTLSLSHLFPLLPRTGPRPPTGRTPRTSSPSCWPVGPPRTRWLRAPRRPLWLSVSFFSLFLSVFFFFAKASSFSPRLGIASGRLHPPLFCRGFRASLFGKERARRRSINDTWNGKRISPKGPTREGFRWGDESRAEEEEKRRYLFSVSFKNRSLARRTLPPLTFFPSKLSPQTTHSAGNMTLVDIPINNCFRSGINLM